MVTVCPSQFATCCLFSSRRRHTRSTRDWSSDVCSSDLQPDSHAIAERDANRVVLLRFAGRRVQQIARSEERRVGKECRCRWLRDHFIKIVFTVIFVVVCSITERYIFWLLSGIMVAEFSC